MLAIIWTNFREIFSSNFALWSFHVFSYMTTLFKKSNFCPKFQFWQNPNIFTSFSPKENQQFSRKIKVEFLDKKWRFRTVWRSWQCHYSSWGILEFWTVLESRTKMKLQTCFTFYSWIYDCLIKNQMHYSNISSSLHYIATTCYEIMLTFFVLYHF